RTAATGAHMSPVSPKPCNMTTAGPLPPTRTWIVVPLALRFRLRTLRGKDPTLAEIDDDNVSPPIGPPQDIASAGMGKGSKEAFCTDSSAQAHVWTGRGRATELNRNNGWRDQQRG